MKHKLNKIALIAFIAALMVHHNIDCAAISIVGENIDYSQIDVQLSSKIRLMSDIADSSNVLIKNGFDQTEIHIFKHSDDGSPEYTITYLDGKNGMLSTRYNDMGQEDSVYKSFGFDSLPDIHITHLSDDFTFVDQKFTGKFADVNCGAAVIEMAM